jgi:hypothetical protein
MVPAKQTVFNSSLLNSLARLVTIGGIGLLCFGCAALLIFHSGRANPNADRAKKTFTWVWVAPGLLFFALVFLKFVNSGYLLVVSPPLFVWLGQRASSWYSDLRFRDPAKIALVTGLAAANSLIFLFAPVYCSYASVRRFETELEDVLRSIPLVASPADTLIVGFDSHFLGYRHAGYYLPAWYTVQFPEVQLASGTRVFVMNQEDTQLVNQLPLARFRNFLLCPLPSDDSEYTEYMVRVRARFPQGSLRTVRTGGSEFTLGSASDLRLLFPLATGTVNTSGHVNRE